MGVKITEQNGKTKFTVKVKKPSYDNVDKKMFDKIVRHYNYILLPKKDVFGKKDINLPHWIGHMSLNLIKEQGYDGNMKMINMYIGTLHYQEKKMKLSMAKFNYILSYGYRQKQKELKAKKNK